MYLIYNTRNGGGWLAASGQLVSNWSDAKQYILLADAIAACVKFKDHNGVGAFPVSKLDLELIEAKE